MHLDGMREGDWRAFVSRIPGGLELPFVIRIVEGKPVVYCEGPSGALEEWNLVSFF